MTAAEPSRKVDVPPTQGGMPSDPEAEQLTLAALMVDPSAIERLSLAPSDFYDEAHRLIYGAMYQLHNEGIPFEPTFLKKELQRVEFGSETAFDRIGGVATLHGILKLSADTRSTVVCNAQHYASLLREKSLRRRLADFGHELIGRSHNGQATGELLDFVQSQANDVEQWANGSGLATKPELTPRAIGELIGIHPNLRPPVIHGLLRQGETLNVIASPKVGKSWLVADLALSIVTGRKWLGLYEVEAGKVLIVDNELHGETIAYRVGKVAEAMGLVQSDYADSLHVINLRGCLTDIYDLGPRVLNRIEPGTYRLIVLDALYRFIPSGVSENDNSAIAQVYNQIDAYALQLECGFACVHHSTKGNQAGKSVTDVGAGAGSQSRATDSHLVLRPHVETDAVVLDAAVRSWPPVKPMALRWEWPLWTPDSDLDPTALKTDRDRQQTADRSADVAAMETDILDTFNHFPDGATQRDVRGRVGKGKAFEAAWLSLTNSGKLTECEVTKSNRQKYPGFKRVYEDDTAVSDT